MIMNGFVPYEYKLEKFNNSYYIEIRIIGKEYLVISMSEDLEDNVMLIYPKSKYTLEKAVLDFEDQVLQIGEPDFTGQGYHVLDLKEKQEFLKKHYPFTNPPDLLDKITCIHCSNQYTVIHYRTDENNRILCPNPKCDGTVIDWLRD